MKEAQHRLTIRKVPLWRAKRLTGRLRALLLKASGHHCKVPATLGYLLAGEIGRIPITDARFVVSEHNNGAGALRVTATAPTAVTGAVGGRYQIEAEDGTVVWLSPVTRPDGYFGVKTAWAAWKITVDCELKPDAGWVTDEQAARNFQMWRAW
jgi:hypothetical protein